ncbi:MAG: hypothetical protein HYY37_00720 [Candidatus Aenigmarchaeota archaeon]|nr:hypothetical protein [Candidatus Aenigmarchaeota archaeon]
MPPYDPEVILKPGNLVHGTSFTRKNYRTLLEWGLVPPAVLEAHGEKTYSLSLDFISFALLSNNELPYRYSRAKHHASKYNDGRGAIPDIAIIVDASKLMDAYPGEVFAVGEHFQQYQKAIWGEDALRWAYNFDEGWTSVFGIPIREGVWPRYDDEVRLMPRNPLEAAVTPDLWAGIVVQERIYEWLSCNDYLLNGSPITFPIPVFSPDCTLLSPTFDLRRKKRTARRR